MNKGRGLDANNRERIRPQAAHERAFPGQATGALDKTSRVETKYTETTASQTSSTGVDQSSFDVEMDPDPAFCQSIQNLARWSLKSSLSNLFSASYCTQYPTLQGKESDSTQ